MSEQSSTARMTPTTRHIVVWDPKRSYTFANLSESIDYCRYAGRNATDPEDRAYFYARLREWEEAFHQALGRKEVPIEN